MTQLGSFTATVILLLIICSAKICYIFSLETLSSTSKQRVIVAGASGYIGRHVVKSLLARGIPTGALVRSSSNLSQLTKKYLQGADIIECDVTDSADTTIALIKYQPTSVICCLASRSGLGADAFKVDYQGGKNVLDALITSSSTIYTPIEQYKTGTHKPIHYVLLSAYCCGKAELQFQFAKLKLEEELKQHAASVSYSIVRPTAFFKSLDGQVETARNGKPIVYFGSGLCSANPIAEVDLANYLVDCAIAPEQLEMKNTIRNIGGPDVPPITKRQQGEMIYDALCISSDKRAFLSLPIAIFDVLIALFSLLNKLFLVLNIKVLQRRFDDAAELCRIVRYYATEPMVATGKGEVVGNIKLIDHFQSISKRGGVLEEVDLMTTTSGVVKLFTDNNIN